MQRTVLTKPRRNLVKKAARTLLLSSNLDKLPIDVDSFFQPVNTFCLRRKKQNSLFR